MKRVERVAGELRHEEAEGGASNGAAVGHGGVVEVAIDLRVERGGERGSGGIAEQQRPIDRGAAAILPRDEGTRDGVQRAVNGVVLDALHVIAAVLMQ